MPQSSNDSESAACRVEIDPAGAFATITLAMPEVRNAFSAALAHSLVAALDEVEETNVRAAALVADGPAFCVGGDLQNFSRELAEGSLVDRVMGDMELFNPLIVRLTNTPVPIIAGLHGAVAGGGLALAAACDIRVCTPDTFFVPGFAGIGLPPDTGTSWLLPRLIGASRATDFLLRNRRMSADEALQNGLVAEIIADPAGRAIDIAKELAAGPRQALASTKHLLLASGNRSFEDQLLAEGVDVKAALLGPELGEGITAFVEKRPAKFP